MPSPAPLVGPFAFPVALALLCGTLAGCAEDEDRPDGLQIPECEEPVEFEMTGFETDGTHFLNGDGQRVWLRGVNTGGRSKFAPFMPFAFQESGLSTHADAPPFDEALEAYVDDVAYLGVNAVRLPFSWEALEPEPGSYSDVYVERYSAMIEAFGARNIGVVVDFHQDVFASPYCGDGFPLWATSLEDPQPADFADCDNWFTRYLSTNAVWDEYDRFWSDEDGLRTAFLAMWEYLAGELVEHENIIAWELLNEPHPGNADEEEWGETTYPALIADFADTIRSVDPDALIAFGAPGSETTTGETVVVPPEREGLIYAPHFYDPVIFALGTSRGVWNPDPILENYAEFAGEEQIPAFVGEFGCRTGQELCDVYLQDVYAILDRLDLDAFAWEYSNAPEDWNNEGFGLVTTEGTEAPALASVVRPFPLAVPTRLERFGWDPVEQVGSAAVVWLDDQGPIMIRYPQRLLDEGATLRVESGFDTACWSAEHSAIVIDDVSGLIEIAFGDL